MSGMKLSRMPETNSHGTHQVDCAAHKCRNSLINRRDGDWSCNLKMIIIDKDGKCEDSIPLINDDAKIPNDIDEFDLMDKLATMLGESAPISKEERNMSSLYKRRVLKSAINTLNKLLNKEKYEKLRLFV